MAVSSMRLFLISTAAVVAIAAPGSAFAQQRSFDLPAQGATRSIPEFARQAGIQIMAPGSKLRAIRTPSLRGNYDARDALRKLIAGSGLRIVSDRDGVITLASAGEMPAAVMSASYVAQAQPAPAEDQRAAPAAEPDPVQEDIIVTATRRETSLQETAAAVSVVGSDEIEKRNLVGMEDYLASLPGVTYGDRGAGQNNIIIRGIGEGSQLSANSPVSSYFGEVPVTGLGPPLNGNGAGNSDLKMVDIARVEVLRGPQGTLYGSGSMGGTVRIIPNAPDLNDFEGNVSAGYSNTARGGSHNYSAEAVANLPIVNDKLALRLVAYHMFNTSYIEDVSDTNPGPNIIAAIARGGVPNPREHAGNDRYTGLRATALWQPIDNLSITAMHIFQSIKQDGLRDVETDLPGLYQQRRLRVGIGGTDNEYVDINLNMSNLVVEYDAGWGSFLNSTSLVRSEADNEIEFTFYGFADPSLLAGAANTEALKKVFVNEFRFASKFQGPFQIIAGLYYENRSTTSHAEDHYTGTFNPPPAGVLAGTLDNRNEQKQYAVFGEASLTPFEPLTVTVGARYFKFEQAIPLARADGIPSNTEGREASMNGVNWKVNVAYKASDEVFVYGQWAQGFRAPQFQRVRLPEHDADGDGLIEFIDGTERAIPDGLLDPDTVDNYEAGVKFQSRNGRFRAGLTGFYIDWKGIPIPTPLTTFGGQAFLLNAGKAVVKGVEFEVSGEVVDNLFAEFSTSWVSSKLAESFPGFGDKGTNLPGSADHNAKAALEKRFDLAGNPAFVRADWTYVGKFYTSFAETGLASGDYHLFDLSAGVTIDRFRIGVYAKNLTNRAEFTWVDNIFGVGRGYRLRPRTIGVNLGVDF